MPFSCKKNATRALPLKMVNSIHYDKNYQIYCIIEKVGLNGRVKPYLLFFIILKGLMTYLPVPKMADNMREI